MSGSARITRRPLRWVVALGLSAVCAALPAAAQDPRTPAYIGSESCTECHTEEAEAWTGSHHALAWTPPDATHVLGDFDNAEFLHKGVRTRFTTEDGRYYITSDGPDGQMTRYPVHSVAGVAPLQQYLIETEPGKIQSFDVVWDVDQARWYHLYPDQDLPYSDGLHWTGPYKNWAARCAECHATGYDKGYDPRSRSYASRQAEIGVGCEACHGPGEAHRDWALPGGSYDPGLWSSVGATGLTMDFTAGAEAEIQQCASCHSRREPFEAGNPLPGTAYHDAYRLTLLRDGTYHPDGQILDEVYVYGSFLQSKMYAKGVACTDCHNPHTAQVISDTNTVCTQCHSPAGNPDFPSLPLADYDTPAHHFHEIGSEGAQCKSCHMIERDYMGIDGRRDHSFRVPRPDLTVRTGAPNACNDCHTDRSAEEMADILQARSPESRHRGPHFADVFARARVAPQSTAENIVALTEYLELPGIVRATALELLHPIATPDLASRMVPLLSDPDPLVRAAAIPVQRAAPNTERAPRLAPLLADPARSVRMAAAREFLNMNLARLPNRVNADLGRAMSDWQASLIARADYPETQIVLAGIGLTSRNMQAALMAFTEAVTMDPQLEQGWTMIVRIHAALGNADAARAAAEDAIAANPDSVPLKVLRGELGP
ncbi:multiheme c-type cytochrome [Dinoroseobacter sp. S375]|uniref:multiheme c-type cytochrome n=1 Tax=Dinoroseobacter sp. S375 TaxID=3415136 RepID=UPI003C7CBC22